MRAAEIIEADIQPETSVLTEFVLELDALLTRWRDSGQLGYSMEFRPTFIEEPPVEGFVQRRRGPLAEITLILVDVEQEAFLPQAVFPVSLKHLALRSGSQRCETP